MSTIQLYKQNPESYEPELLGSISESQLDFLIDNLEEDFEEEEDCFITSDTIEYLKEHGADEGLIQLLEKALVGAPDGVDISYQLE